MSTTLGNVSVGTTVKLNVNGAAKEFLVVHQGLPSDMYDASCNGTWLLMTDIFAKGIYGTESQPASNIYSTLDDMFTTELDSDILQHVHQVKIPYYYWISNRNWGLKTGANGWSTKAFLLSGIEVGINKVDYSYSEDGTKLSYFTEGETTDANNKRKAKYNGHYDIWWLRTPMITATGTALGINNSGTGDSYTALSIGNHGIRPALVLDTTLTVLDDGTITTNAPPTAPGSINVSNVIKGQTVTITLTAATDPDGTVASYIYERSVDGSAWEQIANVNSLTSQDVVGSEWGTVAYRAKAVDDYGDSGPYVTSQTSVVNSGWVIISGPANDMGNKPAPFEFELSVSISGQETSDNITVDVTLDGKSVYSQAVAPNTPISIDVDTRTMRTGSHSFAVAASCDTYVPASGEYTFNVPEITIPDGGRMDRLEGQDGETIFPITLARAVAGLENYGVESKVHPGAYTGTGTYGTDNPNTLEFEFEPKMVLIQGTAGRVAILIKPSGVGVSIGPNESTTLNVTWQGKAVSWYNALNAANQMNTENETYSYTAFG